MWRCDLRRRARALAHRAEVLLARARVEWILLWLFLAGATI